MKKLYLWLKIMAVASILTAAPLAISGCAHNGGAEEVGEEIDEAAEDTGEAIEDAADEVEDWGD